MAHLLSRQFNILRKKTMKDRQLVPQSKIATSPENQEGKKKNMNPALSFPREVFTMLDTTNKTKHSYQT